MRWNRWIQGLPPERRKPRRGRGFRDIGAPRFELGTSPTRTVRATRLRHAPNHHPVFHRDGDGTLAPLVPAPTADIVAFLDELLEIERFADLGPNGLQVPGAERGHDASSRASRPSAQLFERALAGGRPARARPSRHPVGLRAAPHRPPPQAARLRLLLANDIALAGYHLPLDAHPEHRQQRASSPRGSAPSSHARAFAFKGEPIGVIATLRRRRHPRRRAVRAASRERHRPRAARLRRRPGARPHARDRLRRRRATRSPRRSTSTSTRSSPASRRST